MPTKDRGPWSNLTLGEWAPPTEHHVRLGRYHRLGIEDELVWSRTGMFAWDEARRQVRASKRPVYIDVVQGERQTSPPERADLIPLFTPREAALVKREVEMAYVDSAERHRWGDFGSLLAQGRYAPAYAIARNLEDCELPPLGQQRCGSRELRRANDNHLGTAIVDILVWHGALEPYHRTPTSASNSILRLNRGELDAWVTYASLMHEAWYEGA